MEDLRCKSWGDGRMQIQSYHHGPGGEVVGPTPPINGMQDLRCYSASYSSQTQTGNSCSNEWNNHNDFKLKKGKSMGGSVSKSWSFSDAELQRKRRVASYKVYSVEGKVKGSLKKSFRWVKERCSKAVHGWW